MYPPLPKKPSSLLTSLKTKTMAAQNTTATRRRHSAASPLFLLLLGLLLSSCYGVSTLYPLSEGEKDLVFREELIGTWEDNANYAVVQKGKDSVYKILMVTETKDSGTVTIDSSFFLGRLIQLENYLFLDCIADKEHPSFQRVGYYSRHTLQPTHFICRLVLRNRNEAMELWQLRYDDICNLLDKKNAAYHLDRETENLIILEPSAQLKRLLVQLAREHPDQWERTTLVRREPASSPKIINP